MNNKSIDLTPFERANAFFKNMKNTLQILAQHHNLSPEDLLEKVKKEQQQAADAFDFVKNTAWEQGQELTSDIVEKLVGFEQQLLELTVYLDKFLHEDD